LESFGGLAVDGLNSSMNFEIFVDCGDGHGKVWNGK
jgi:hypothetical protein